jgi:polar amino acid transport system substrate-binding protein
VYKKTFAFLSLTVIVASLFTACSNKNEQPAQKAVSSHADFMGTRIGTVTGSIYERIVEEDFKGKVGYYTEISAGVEDIRRGRINGFLGDLTTLQLLVALEGNDDLICVPVPHEIFSSPLGAISLNQGIIDRFNVFLAGLETDGTLEDMQDRWLNAVPDLDSPMPDIPTKETNGKLRVATSAIAIPFTYRGGNGELKGYCIELIRRFAAHEEVEIEFSDIDFAGLIPFIVTGKADIGIMNVAITEERKKSVLFSDPFFYESGGIIALKPGGTSRQTKIGFIEWLKTGIERNLITDNRWELIVDGLAVTMIIAVFAQIFGTVLGCFVCWLLTRKNKFVRGIGKFYCGLINGLPVVVLLMITYYIIFGSTNISNVIAAVAAFTMVVGSMVAQNLKRAIDTVDPVEIEAARSIGFTAFGAFMTVTFPQAVRRSMPAYTNGFVELVKMTAIVGYIAIQDLTRAGDIIRSRTYDAFFPLLCIAVIYLVVTTICVQIFRLVVNRINGGEQ